MTDPRPFRFSLPVILLAAGGGSALLAALWRVNFNVPALLMIAFLWLWLVQSAWEIYGLAASTIRFLLNPLAAFQRKSRQGSRGGPPH